MPAKGRTERAIRYLRDSFFEGRAFSTIADLNLQLEEWLIATSDQRPWPDDREYTVIKMFAEEDLGTLPATPYETYEECRVRVDKKAYISFDTNKYPVDPKWVGFHLVLRACHDTIYLYHGDSKVETYERQWGRGVKVHSADHQQKIADDRGIKRQRRDRSALARGLPSGAHLLKAWAEQGYNLCTSARDVVGYINDYGVEKVEDAAKVALTNGTSSSCSIAFLLARDNEPPRQIAKVRLRDDLAEIAVTQPPMSDYDKLYNP